MRFLRVSRTVRVPGGRRAHRRQPIETRRLQTVGLLRRVEQSVREPFTRANSRKSRVHVERLRRELRRDQSLALRRTNLRVDEISPRLFDVIQVARQIDILRELLDAKRLFSGKTELGETLDGFRDDVVGHVFQRVLGD